MDKRTAREITVKSEFLNNSKINAKIGTVENRDFPQTVYITISFWIKPKNTFGDERIFLENKLKNILNDKLIKFLNKNDFYPLQENNIYIYNIPENFNYNGRFNFISLEVYLHTINVKSEKKFPLNSKKNTELFEECITVCNFIGDSLNEVEEVFQISKSSKTKPTIINDTSESDVS